MGHGFAALNSSAEAQSFKTAEVESSTLRCNHKVQTDSCAVGCRNECTRRADWQECSYDSRRRGSAQRSPYTSSAATQCSCLGESAFQRAGLKLKAASVSNELCGHSGMRSSQRLTTLGTCIRCGKQPESSRHSQSRRFVTCELARAGDAYRPAIHRVLPATCLLHSGAGHGAAQPQQDARASADLLQRVLPGGLGRAAGAASACMRPASQRREASTGSADCS